MSESKQNSKKNIGGVGVEPLVIPPYDAPVRQCKVNTLCKSCIRILDRNCFIAFGAKWKFEDGYKKVIACAGYEVVERCVSGAKQRINFEKERH